MAWLGGWWSLEATTWVTNSLWSSPSSSSPHSIPPPPIPPCWRLKFCWLLLRVIGGIFVLGEWLYQKVYGVGDEGGREATVGERWSVKGKARILLGMQGLLKRELLHHMNDLPKTGLYSHPPNLPQFKAYLHYMRQLLASGPRSTLLRKLNYEAEQKYLKHKDVQRVYSLLSLPPSAQFLELDIHRRQMSPGAVFTTLQTKKHTANSEFPQKKMAGIEEGIRKAVRGEKKKKKGKGKEGGGGVEEEQEGKKKLSEEEVEQEVMRRVRGVVERHEREVEKAREEALRLTLELENDQEYQDYLFVEGVWERYGYKEMGEEWGKMNRGLGERRWEGGRGFEDLNLGLLCEMVCLSEGWGEGRGEGGEEFYGVGGALWEDSRGKHFGEIDLVVIRRFPSHSPSVECEEEIAAILEMKTNCFEVGCGFEQQQRHLALLLADKENNVNNINNKKNKKNNASSPPTTLSIFHPQTKHKLTINPKRKPKLYLATVIPANGYKIGAPASLSPVYADLFSRKRRGEPVAKGRGKGGKEKEKAKEKEREKEKENEKEKEKGVFGWDDEKILSLALSLQERPDLAYSPFELLAEGNVIVI